MSSLRYHIVFNPLASAGAAAESREAVLRMVETVFGAAASLCVIEGPNDAAASTRDALRGGAELVIAIGGDGTMQQVASGFLAAGNGSASTARLGMLSIGTGCGFAQSLGISGTIAEQLALIRRGIARPVDLATLTNGRGAAGPVSVCVNECQFGIGGTVVRRVRGRIKRLGGRPAFGIGAAVVALTQRPHLFTLRFDGGPEESHLLLGLVVANGAYTGGGMELVPGAVTGDGLLDVLLIRHMSVLQRLRTLPLIYSGKHVLSEGYALRSCRELSVATESEVDCEADGELLPPGPRTIRVLPKAIHVITSEGGAS